MTVLTEVRPVTGTYPIPSKWDIIPIHTSDRGTFKDCRRKWSWSSPSRRNLMPKAMVHGIREPLWFGTGIHYALQKYYDPQLKEDPETTWRAWFNLEWNGGIVSEDEVKAYADRNPIRLPNEPLTSTDADGNTVWEGYPPDTYHVEGLSTILPHPDEEHFMEVLDLGAGMMRFYKAYAEANDNFDVIATEHDFSVPILDPKGNPLYMPDTRKMPDNWQPDFSLGNDFGPLIRPIKKHNGWYYQDTGEYEKQVHARGRMDKIVQEREFGLYQVVDYKTTNRLDEDYFRHQELDEQVTTYLWAGELEAKIHDLPYKSIDQIVYEGLFKGYPKPPTMTTKGLPSINRQSESTTAAMFEECIIKNGLKIIFDNDVKMQQYYAWLLEVGDRRFIDRRTIRRNAHHKRNMGIRIYFEALDMLSSPVGYPNPRKEYSCLNCIFRGPCIAAEDGSDYEAILTDGYMPNWDR